MCNKEKNYQQAKKNPCIRELTLKNGLSFPSDSELLMLILGSGTKDTPIEILAQEVLDIIKESNRNNLLENLNTVKGMGHCRSLAVAAALELGRRRAEYLNAVINKPSEIIPYVKQYSIEQKEHFICVSLNGAHEILNIRLVSIGTISKTLIHPREIFADPVAEHASAVICCHNHPFGPCLPSNADTASTKILQEAAHILGITFLDHIIIGKNGDYFSFLEHNMISS